MPGASVASASAVCTDAGGALGVMVSLLEVELEGRERFGDRGEGI